MENIGAKLVRQAAAKTNDLAGDGTTTSVVLAQGLIAEGVKVCEYFPFPNKTHYYCSTDNFNLFYLTKIHLNL